MHCRIVKRKKITFGIIAIILLTKTTAAQSEVALSYHKVRGLYFPAVVIAVTIEKYLGKENVRAIQS